MNSPDGELRRCWIDILHLSGIRIVKDIDGMSPTVLLWDIDPWNEQRAKELKRYCSQHAGTTVIAIANFAHPEDVADVRKCGAIAVIDKLTAATKLVKAIEGALQEKSLIGLGTSAA